MKWNTLKKMKKNDQTGAGGEDQLSPLDHAVLDIIGRDSVQIKGIGLEDDSPQIGSLELSSKMSSTTAVCIQGLKNVLPIFVLKEMHNNIIGYHEMWLLWQKQKQISKWEITNNLI